MRPLARLSVPTTASISRQDSVFGSQSITVKVQSIIGNMAPGFLVVIVVVLSVQIDDQVPPIVINFNFYGLGCKLIKPMENGGELDG